MTCAAPWPHCRPGDPEEFDRPFRLPIDRSFAMRGFGSVVTGTLLSGSVKVEDEVESIPCTSVRVRGVQVHGQAADARHRRPADRRESRRDRARRGRARHGPDRPVTFRDTQPIDCVFDLLPSAKPLRHRAPVHFHAGTAEIEAELRRIETTKAARARHPRLRPSRAPRTRRCCFPATASSSACSPPSSPSAEARSSTPSLPARRPWSDCISSTLQRTTRAGSPSSLAKRRSASASHLWSSGLHSPKPWSAGTPPRCCLTGSSMRAVPRKPAKRGGIRSRLFIAANPLLPGMPKEQLRGRVPAPVFEELLKREPLIKSTGDVLHLVTHKIAFKQDEEEALGKIEAAFERAGLRAPAVNEVLAGSGVEAARARSLLQILLRDRKLVRISEDLVFHRDALVALRSLLAERKGSRFGVGEFKDWTGISRKYAIPLLEMLDRERVTRRDGDSRVVL